MIAGSLHNLTKCRELCTSCKIVHPHLPNARVIGLASCIYIRIVDEKAQMQMQVQGHWACPYP
jgi:hypothetical protein